jgi:hypothetical protein
MILNKKNFFANYFFDAFLVKNPYNLLLFLPPVNQLMLKNKIKTIKDWIEIFLMIRYSSAQNH